MHLTRHFTRKEYPRNMRDIGVASVYFCDRLIDPASRYVYIWFNITGRIVVYSLQPVVTTGCKYDQSQATNAWRHAASYVLGRHKISTKSYWSECNKLIEIVRRLPVLWQTDHADYGKRGPRFAAWKSATRQLQSDDIVGVARRLLQPVVPTGSKCIRALNDTRKKTQPHGWTFLAHPGETNRTCLVESRVFPCSERCTFVKNVQNCDCIRGLYCNPFQSSVCAVIFLIIL